MLRRGILQSTARFCDGFFFLRDATLRFWSHGTFFCPWMLEASSGLALRSPKGLGQGASKSSIPDPKLLVLLRVGLVKIPCAVLLRKGGVLKYEQRAPRWTCNMTMYYQPARPGVMLETGFGQEPLGEGLAPRAKIPT